MSEENQEYDVIVVGGGPAGTTVGAILSGEYGRRVLVLEKEKMPRYHIGESLMPFCWYTFDRLGVTGKLDELGFVHKLSVQFVTPDGAKSNPFYFFQHRDHPSSTTWQVTRSAFDEMLFENAKAKGADCRDGVRVRGILRDGQGAVEGVEAVLEGGERVEFRSRMVVDCTGRDALVASKEGWRTRDPKLKKIAVWTYFRGAKRDPGLDAGSTTVAYIPEKGWFWYIPLADDVVSVGVVAERDYLYRDPEVRDPGAIMAREVEENLWIKDHLAPGEQFGEYWVTGEYSYRAKYCAGDGLILAGDAFAFLDPVFSSGVFLALKSGEMAADAVEEALVAGDVSASRFDGYGQQLCGHIETMRKIVYAFYEKGFSFGKVIRKNPEIRGRITDCLIGDMGKDFEEMFRCMGEFAELPGALEYGTRGLRAEEMARNEG